MVKGKDGNHCLGNCQELSSAGVSKEGEPSEGAGGSQELKGRCGWNHGLIWQLDRHLLVLA